MDGWMDGAKAKIEEAFMSKVRDTCPTYMVK
jgi:hypothetical protein